ncbi:uncharacterized protein LOC114535996 [Dendronephthya gigantea]|uniref:uncharacterized protein LOC114535996 n=1 Tax=Dendronephthya gigantea TaxID=151771 RepID=UPI00106B29F4|nr:uncharacterized protein LOC114535996 [Dendronephthya gigantea]
MVANKKIYGQDDNPSSNNVHSLLSFMNLASNKVKTALEKPNTFKRNINHRRFLQKQFRAIVKNPEKGGAGKKSFTKDSIESMNFTLRECNGQSYPPPLTHNFLQFNTLQTSNPNLGFAEPSFPIPFARNAACGIENLPERQMTCHGQIRKQSSCLYQAPEEYSSITSTPELVVEEDFLTCEELTQALELKDLFIPDTDLTQYLLNGKENIGDFCNNDGSLGMDNWQARGSFGLQEDILVF